MLQVDQLLPEQPLPGSSTLWRNSKLDHPAPDGSGVRRRPIWVHSQMDRACRSIGNLLLLQSMTPLRMQQKMMEFEEKKQIYLNSLNAGLFPMSAKVLQKTFFSCDYEYADRQRAYINCLARVYGL